MSRYERQLRRLVRRAGPDWEVVRAGTVQVGDMVIVDDSGPVEVVSIDPANAEVPAEWGEPFTMNLDNRLAFFGTTEKLMGRKNRL